jgi:hypothetical protein
VTRLTRLDAEFADGNVVLGVLLGVLGACSTIRVVLPEPVDADANVEDASAVDPFVALLLGVVAVHERLATLVDSDAAEPVAGEESVTLMRLVGLTR